MNWGALGAIAELLGALAVFTTLVFLAVQLKYANVLARSSAASAQSNRLSDRFIRVAENKDFAALMTKQWDSDDLTDVEKTQISYYIAMLIHSASDAYNQWRLGVVEEGVFTATLRALRTGIMQNQTAKAIWAVNKITLSQKFVHMFEAVVYPEGFSTKAEDSHLVTSR